MAPQSGKPTSAAQTPAQTCQADYFGSSSQSSAADFSRTSVDPPRSAVTSAPSKSTTIHSIPPLSRDFPKPFDAIDITEALSRKPGRWTIQGSVAAMNTAASPIVDEKKEKAKHQKALADAKKNLVAASESLKTIITPPRKNNP